MTRKKKFYTELTEENCPKCLEYYNDFSSGHPAIIHTTKNYYGNLDLSIVGNRDEVVVIFGDIVSYDEVPTFVDEEEVFEFFDNLPERIESPSFGEMVMNLVRNHVKEVLDEMDRQGIDPLRPRNKK